VAGDIAHHTDEQLVVAARDALSAGDGAQARRCAGLLWLRLETRVRLRVARRVPPQHVDDVCATVAEHVSRYVYRSAQTPDSMVAVALRIADRRIADHTRAAKDAPEPMADVDDHLAGAVDGRLDGILDRAEADGFLAHLDERAATILRRTAAGDAPDRVAGDLGIRRSHLDVIAHRARKRLRALMEEAG
jgi:DNA-directed RNA polymerase specialized sigma24 family protein